jgi:hypothetical protein
MPEPWDRQRDEGGTLEPMFWFDRFDRFYRPVGPERSLVGAYNAWRREAKKSQVVWIASSWQNNATKWHWKERAEAWDVEQRRQRFAEEEIARAEMVRRHVRLAVNLQAVGATRLTSLSEADVNAGEARQYLKDGIALERQARGLPEHLIAVAGMSDDELLTRYHQLVAGIGGTGSRDGEEGDPAPAEDEPL